MYCDVREEMMSYGRGKPQKEKKWEMTD